MEFDIAKGTYAWELLRNALHTEHVLVFHKFISSRLMITVCQDQGRRWVSGGSFHECLVVFLGDGLVRNPDIAVDYFRIRFLFDHKIGGVDSFIALANGILEHGI